MKIQIKRIIPLLFRKEKRNLLNFKMLFLLIVIVMIGLPTAKAQVATSNNLTQSRLSIGIKGGYDHPLFSMPFNELNYKGGRYLGANLDYRFASRIGIRLDYANIKTQPNFLIPDSIYYGTNSAPVLKNRIPITRHFVGLGPTYTIGNEKLHLLVAPMGGYSWLSGGDAVATSMDIKAPTGTTPDLLLVNTGFNDQAWSAKLDLELNYAITNNLRLTLGAYYLRHFGVHLDTYSDLGYGTLPIAHGEAIFDHTLNPYTFTNLPPNVVVNDPINPNVWIYLPLE